jgi:serine protease inhibitor
MKTKQITLSLLVLFLIALILISFTACCSLFDKGPKTTKANKESDKAAENIDKNLVDTNTEFALNLFNGLANEDSSNNIFISPISISIAMAMAYNGAIGTSQKEISNTLKFTGYNPDSLNNAFKLLLSSMSGIDEMVELYTGSSIWLKNDLEINKDFQYLAENYYNASINPADFDSSDTVNKINDWVSKVTEGKIKNIASPSSLKDEVMYLVNAIYFKGQWKDKFKQENTGEDDFFLADKSSKKVQMMNNSGKFDYYRGEKFQMLRMPYGRDKSAMYVLLPDEGFDINDLSASLTFQLLNNYILQSSNEEVILKFPKFDIDYSVNLKKILSNMGINTPFDKDTADFGGIAPGLFISQIDHKAIIEVNEEGTIAAAATSFGMGATAARPVEFTVNRPFILFIRDDRTGNILFEGRIMQP